jgi:hypothetical protein
MTAIQSDRMVQVRRLTLFIDRTTRAEAGSNRSSAYLIEEIDANTDKND